MAFDYSNAREVAIAWTGAESALAQALETAETKLAELIPVIRFALSKGETLRAISTGIGANPANESKPLISHTEVGRLGRTGAFLALPGTVEVTVRDLHSKITAYVTANGVDAYAAVIAGRTQPQAWKSLNARASGSAPAPSTADRTCKSALSGLSKIATNGLEISDADTYASDLRKIIEVASGLLAAVTLASEEEESPAESVAA